MPEGRGANIFKVQVRRIPSHRKKVLPDENLYFTKQ